MKSPNDRDFQPIADPYIVGNPIKDPNMFFGREDDFTYVKKKLSTTREGGMIVLCGARRSGKTSILFQISGGRLGDGLMPVLIDMQSMAIRNDRDFLGKLGGEIIAALGGSAYLETFDGELEENPFKAIEELVKKINHDRDGKSLVLMFDEYELFETNIDSGIISSRVLYLLANLIEHKRVFVIFTGSDNLEARDKPYWGVFLSKALHRRISFLSKGDTLRLILEPLKGQVHYEEGVPEKIFRLTAGQPFYTQVLCQSIVDRLNENRRYDVVSGDVEDVVGEIIENPLPQMIFNWNALSDLEKISLSVIAEIGREKPQTVTPKDIVRYLEKEKTGYRLDPGELNKTLESLFHSDLLHKEGPRDIYSFKMDLWRSWVTRMHSVWQVIDEMERSEDGPSVKGIISEDAARRKRVRLSVVMVACIAVALPVATWFVKRSMMGPEAVSADVTSVSIGTDPPEASIRIGDRWAGRSPVVGVAIPVGRRVLVIEREGYKPVTDTLSLLSGVPLDTLYTLTRIIGTVEVSSLPPGAAVMVDGQSTGLTTPAVLSDLSATRHEVEVSLPGYESARENLEVLGDSSQAVAFHLSKKTGSLSIVSQPSGADVYIDGVLVGTTPLIEPVIDYGAHRLRISKPAHQVYEQDMVISNPSDKVDVDLAQLPPGKVVFSIQPYADVFVDDELVWEDITHREKELPPGWHQIRLEHPEFGVHVDSVNVESGRQVTVQYQFTGRE
jgi:AAA+ ATPase superfamily predicted ATPase